VYTWDYNKAVPEKNCYIFTLLPFLDYISEIVNEDFVLPRRPHTVHNYVVASTSQSVSLGMGIYE